MYKGQLNTIERLNRYCLDENKRIVVNRGKLVGLMPEVWR